MDWFITITLSYTNIIHYWVFDLIHSAKLERFHYRDWYKHYTNSSCTFRCSFIHFFKAKRKHKCRQSLLSYLFPLFGKRKKTMLKMNHAEKACMHVLSPTLCNPLDCGPSGSSVHGILHARILGQVATASSRGFSWPRHGTNVSYVSCTGRWILLPLSYLVSLGKRAPIAKI